MLGHRLLIQIYEEWATQAERQLPFLKEIHVCKELGDALKIEGFAFKFNPNEIAKLDGDEYNSEEYDFELPIKIKHINKLIDFKYK